MAEAPRDGMFYVEWDWRGWNVPPVTAPSVRVGVWNIALAFTREKNALEACLLWRERNPGGVNLRVVRNGQIIWQEGHTSVTSHTAYSALSPQEEKMADNQQPLHVPRTALIETLQTNLEAEKAERAKAQAAITARRQAAQDAVASLSPDEMLNLVQQYVSRDLDNVVTMVEEAHKSGRLKSQDQVAGPKESSLEKWVRVLNLATDETIEVKPTDPVYSLL